MTYTYIEGYTRALIEMKSLLENRSEDMNRYKILKYKDNRNVCRIIDEMIRKREMILLQGIDNLIVYEKDGMIRIEEGDKHNESNA